MSVSSWLVVLVGRWLVDLLLLVERGMIGRAPTERSGEDIDGPLGICGCVSFEESSVVDR